MGASTTHSADSPHHVARVDEAMRVIDRADFLPEAVRDQAHLDHPLLLADGSTNSQPSTVRRMLQALQVQPGDRVLDIGSGSGWTSGLLGYLTGPSGRVLGLDLTDFLISLARESLANYDMPWVRVELAEPDVLGRPGEVWDRILVSADGGTIPTQLTDQLADGGRMVIPAAGRMAVITREGEGIHTDYLPGRWAFVKLR